MIPLLLMQISNPDDRAFITNLYNRHRVLMFRIAIGILKSEHDAEDAINDTILKLMRRISELKEKDDYNLKFYVMSTIRNAAIDRYRRRKIERKYAFHGESVAQRVRDDEMPETSVIRACEGKELMAALKQLPQDELNLLMKKHVLDLKTSEIAEELGITESSVRVYLSRAKKHAKEILKGEKRNDEAD